MTIIRTFSHGIVWTYNECQEYAKARFHTEFLKSTIYRHGMAAWIPIADCFSAAIPALSGASRDPQALRAAFEGLRNGMVQLGHPGYYTTLARAMLAIGQPDDAARTIEYVFQLGMQPWVLPEILRLRAATERATGHDDLARASLEASLEMSDFCPAWQLRAATDLAQLLTDGGATPSEARAVLRPAYERFGDGYETGDMLRARHLLGRLGKGTESGSPGAVLA